MAVPPSFLFAGVDEEILSLNEELQSLGGGNARLEKVELYTFIRKRSREEQETLWSLEGAVKLRDLSLPRSAPEADSTTSFPVSRSVISQSNFCATEAGSELIDKVSAAINGGFNMCVLGVGGLGADKTSSLFGEFYSRSFRGSDETFASCILQSLYHYARINAGNSTTRITLSIWAIQNHEIIDLLAPVASHAEPLDFTNVLCDNLDTALTVVSDARSRLPSLSTAHFFLRVMVHTRAAAEADAGMDEGNLSVLYLVDTADVIACNVSSYYKSLPEKEKLAARSRQVDMVHLFKVLAEMRAISASASPHNSHRSDKPKQPIRQITTARSSKLTTLLAPILQGNMKTMVACFLRDGEGGYPETKSLLIHLRGLSDIISACFKVQGVSWHSIHHISPSQILAPVDQYPGEAVDQSLDSPSLSALPKRPLQHLATADLRMRPSSFTMQLQASPAHSVGTDFGDIDLEAIASGAFDLRRTPPGSSASARRVFFAEAGGNLSPFSAPYPPEDISLPRTVSEDTRDRLPLADLSALASSLDPRKPTATARATPSLTTTTTTASSHRATKSKASPSDPVEQIMREFHQLVGQLRDASTLSDAPPPPSQPFQPISSSSIAKSPPRRPAWEVEQSTEDVHVDESTSFLSSSLPRSWEGGLPSSELSPQDNLATWSLTPSRLSVDPSRQVQRSVQMQRRDHVLLEEKESEAGEEDEHPREDSGSSFFERDQKRPKTTMESSLTTSRSTNANALWENGIGATTAIPLRTMEVIIDEEETREGLPYEQQEYSGHSSRAPYEAARDQFHSHLKIVRNSEENDDLESAHHVVWENLLRTRCGPQTSGADAESVHSEDSLSVPASRPQASDELPRRTASFLSASSSTDERGRHREEAKMRENEGDVLLEEEQEEARHFVPTEIRDLPTALQEIERLRTRQAGLLQTIRAHHAEQQSWQKRYQALQEDLAEVRAHYEVELDGHKYELRQTKAKLRQACQEHALEDMFATWEHDLQRLIKENARLQQANVALENRLLDLDRKSASAASVSAEGEQPAQQLANQHIARLSERLKKLAQEKASVQAAYEQIKSRERRFDYQDRLVRDLRQRLQKMYVEYQRGRKTWELEGKQHLELQRQFQALQTFCHELKQTNEKLLQENSALNQEGQALRQRLKDVEHDQLRARKLQHFTQKHSTSSTSSMGHIGARGKGGEGTGGRWMGRQPSPDRDGKAFTKQRDTPSPTELSRWSSERMTSSRSRVALEEAEETTEMDRRESIQAQRGGARLPRGYAGGLHPPWRSSASDELKGLAGLSKDVNDFNYSISHLLGERMQSGEQPTSDMDKILDVLQQSMVDSNPALLPLVRKLEQEIHTERMRSLQQRSHLLEKIHVVNQGKKGQV